MSLSGFPGYIVLPVFEHIVSKFLIMYYLVLNLVEGQWNILKNRSFYYLNSFTGSHRQTFSNF